MVDQVANRFWTRTGRALAGHRWLVGAIAVLVVTTSLLDPTLGASKGTGILDLAGGDEPGSLAPADPPLLPPDAEPPWFAEVLSPEGRSSVEPTPEETTQAPAPVEVEPAPRPQPCASAAVLDAVAAAQAAIESTGGAQLPIDVAGLFGQVAGCGEAGANPLDVLAVVGQVLDGLGIDRIPLPPPLELPLPAVPGAEALGPVVLPVCAQVIQQLVTAAALAPVARIDTREVVALFDPVIEVCARFAPEA